MTLKLLMTSKKPSHLTKVAIVTTAALVSGCVSLLPDPAPADVIYKLTPHSENIRPQSGAFLVRIDSPISPRSLNTQDIVLSTNKTELASASGARWSESIPILVQRGFVDYLNTREGLIGVLPNSGARPDYRLSLNLKSFEADFDQGDTSAPLAVVDYNVTLSNASTRELIGVFNVRETQRARAIRVSEIVKAQNTAHAAALEDIADWMADILKTYTEAKT